MGISLKKSLFLMAFLVCALSLFVVFLPSGKPVPQVPIYPDSILVKEWDGRSDDLFAPVGPNKRNFEYTSQASPNDIRSFYEEYGASCENVETVLNEKYIACHGIADPSGEYRVTIYTDTKSDNEKDKYSMKIEWD